MDGNDTKPTRKLLRDVLVILLAVLIITFVFRLTEAGSLTPPGTPAGTLHSLSEIFAPLASSGYDSSGVVPSRTGNALQVTKCIIRKMTGQTPCP